MLWGLTICTFVSDCDCESVVLVLKNEMLKMFAQYEGIYKKVVAGPYTYWKSGTNILEFWGRAGTGYR